MKRIIVNQGSGMEIMCPKLYIYIYITEISETPTIFHVNTI